MDRQSTLSHPEAEIYIPDSRTVPDALSRTTRLGIGAHPDDLAVEGRHRANATFGDPRAADGAERVAFAVDLTPLFSSDLIRPEDFFAGFVERLGAEIERDLKSCR